MGLLAGETGACLSLLTDGLFSPLVLAGRAPVQKMMDLIPLPDYKM
jgi:hypothetical protein